MGIIAIANISNGDTTIGFRLMDTETKLIKDVPINNIINVLNSKNLQISNLDIRDNKIVGVNGSIYRLPKIVNGQLVGKSPLLILNQVVDMGYTIVDFKGQIEQLPENKVIEYASLNGIVNGKVVTKDYNIYISPIKGEYEKVIDRAKFRNVMQKARVTFDYCEMQEDDTILVRTGERLGLLSPTGRTILKPLYKYIWSAKNNTYVVRQDNLYGLVDYNGDFIAEQKYSNMCDYNDGLYRVVDKGDWGCIDGKGNIVIPLRYSELGEFCEGLAFAKTEGGYGYINKQNERVINTTFVQAGNFSNGLAEVALGYRWRFIDRNGKVVTYFDYDKTEPFSDGFASVTRSRKSGYIDKTGYEKIALKYKYAGTFHEGMAAVMNDKGKYNYINTEEQILLRGWVDHGCHFSDGLAAICQEGRWGFINKQGEGFYIGYDANLTYNLSYSEGLALVMKKEKYGFINKNGGAAIPFMYNTASDFNNGRAKVSLDGNYFFYIDKAGNRLDE